MLEVRKIGPLAVPRDRVPPMVRCHGDRPSPLAKAPPGNLDKSHCRSSFDSDTFPTRDGGVSLTMPVSGNNELEKRGEMHVFLLLAVVLVPVISVLMVGGFGLIVWIYQLIAGPPGPPH